MTSNLTLIILTAQLFGGGASALRYTATFSGILIPALIASRASAILGLAGLIASYLYSVLCGITSRKASIGVLGAIGIAIMIPVALLSFQNRFKSDQWGAFNENADYDERRAYKDAAWAMIADHPMGVGPNNFVVVANTDGYYRNAGVNPNSSSLMGHVHNIYILTWAEDGFIGLLTLIPLFFFPAWGALRGSWRLRKTLDGDILGGAAMALIFTYIHSFYEWMFIGADPQYVLVAVYGIIAGLLLRNEAKLGLKKVMPGAEGTQLKPRPQVRF